MTKNIELLSLNEFYNRVDELYSGIDFYDNDKNDIAFQLDKLIIEVKRYVDKYPNESELFYLLGLFYYKYPSQDNEALTESERFFLKAVEINAKHFLALFFLGCLYFDIKKYKKSYVFFGKIPDNNFADTGQAWRDLKIKELMLCCRYYRSWNESENIILFKELSDLYQSIDEEDRPFPLEIVRCVCEMVENDNTSFISVKLSKMCLRFIHSMDLQEAFSEYIEQLSP